MRNLFDQYSQPENRLTHALAVCLNEDRRLLKGFLARLGVRPPASAAALALVEQSLPGDPPEAEADAERRGLPDIVIHDGDSWCVLIESKVQAKLTVDQLRRHARTLRRRGFQTVHCVALTKSGVRTPKGTIGLDWSGLYEWLGLAAQRGEWADRVREYLRAAEVRLAREAYLTEGTLTMFDGFPFSEKNPYTYGEAKRLLKLALDELKHDKILLAMGMDPKSKGRGAITGKQGKAVWDFLSLTDRPKGKSFTSFPHLTLAVHDDHLEVALTIPHGAIAPVRRRLAELGPDGLIEVNAQILRRARKLIAAGAAVRAIATQRHYKSQRSKGITDADLWFKLETSQPKRSGRVKPQREWVELFAAIAGRKRSNIQFQYRVHMPWDMKGLASRQSLKLIVAGWVALEPLLEAIRADH